MQAEGQLDGSQLMTSERGWCVGTFAAGQPNSRPAQRDQLERGGVQRRIKVESAQISRGCFIPFSLHLQRMTELQMRIRGVWIELDRFPISLLGFRHLSGLLQGVAVLHPYRRVTRVSVER